MHCLLVTIIYNQFLPVKLQAPLEETMTAPLATFCEITQKPVLAETDVARMERAAFVRSFYVACICRNSILEQSFTNDESDKDFWRSFPFAKQLAPSITALVLAIGQIVLVLATVSVVSAWLNHHE